MIENEVMASVNMESKDETREKCDVTSNPAKQDTNGREITNIERKNDVVIRGATGSLEKLKMSERETKL